MLTEMGLDTIEHHTRESMLLTAQASLDHALKSANIIYANENEHNGGKLSRRRSLASSSSGGIHSENGEKKERMVRIETMLNYEESVCNLLFDRLQAMVLPEFGISLTLSQY